MPAPIQGPEVGFDDIPGELPQTVLPENGDLTRVADDALGKLNELSPECLTEGVLWRDFLSFTDSIRTLHSRNTVYSTLKELSTLKSASPFRLGTKEPRKIPFGWIDIEIFFSVQHGTLTGSGAGIVSMLHDRDGKWRIWMLRTWLESFEGHGHPDESRPFNYVNELMNDGPDTKAPVYDAIVVGGGLAGLASAGRLQALGLRYLLIEKTPQVGDIWRNRYDSLRFHTPKEYGVLPFGWRFPVEDDKCLPAKRIGAGHLSWAMQFGINVQAGTTVKSANYDETNEIWTILATCAEGDLPLRARNLVLAIGPNASVPSLPEWASTENVKASGFTGDLMHASAWKSAKPWEGKRGIVVGVANTGHDVAEDMANTGMETTMIQRGSTWVFPVEWLHAVLDRDYHAEKSAAESDRELTTMPNKIGREIANIVIHGLVRANPERFDALEKQGFKLNRFGDLYQHLFQRFGGHYVDIGASARIASGEIKVKSSAIKGLGREGLIFEDGTMLPADLIVLATGFKHDFREHVGGMIGEKSAKLMDQYGGMDAEGEMRGFGRPMARKLGSYRW
jgi:cation diffusion facilitator CzcD-associated flavoprotein CzcO